MVNEERDPHQLFGLVRRMAQAGDWEARQCLYAAFDRQVAHEDFRGASEFIALDGLRGFLFVTDHFLRCKRAGGIEEDNLDWEWWLSELEDRDSKDTTQAALRQLTSDVPGLSELLQLAEAERAKWQQTREENKENSTPACCPLCRDQADDPNQRPESKSRYADDAGDAAPPKKSCCRPHRIS